MNADRLYYKDDYLTEFTACVTGCEKAEKGYRITLSDTAFYPEGGGQPYDTGVLIYDDKKEPVHVLEVQEEDGEVVHTADAPIEEGTSVTGKIDWERRFDLMQQHSGEHIVSGLVHAAFGYDNVGFHLGSDTVTIDFNGDLSWEDLKEIELKANEVIWANGETRVSYPEKEELPLITYRSKKALSGTVRLVEFPGDSGNPEFPYADRCACCGLHVKRAGEIGMIKILSVMKFREGVRVEIISGKRVLTYLDWVSEQNHQVSVLLSAKPEKTAEAVKRMSDENYELRGRVSSLEAESFEREAERLSGAGDVVLFESGLDPEGVRKLCVAVMETCGGRCAVFSDNGDGTCKYAVGETGGDLKDFVKRMNAALAGRGGGKPNFAQGSVKAKEDEIRAFFEAEKN